MNKRNLALVLLGEECVRCLTDLDLHFDHIDASTKSFNISSARVSTKRLLEELKKCQLLCRSCHGRKTREDHPKPIKHGTPGGYSNRKCRCADCRDAWAKYRYSKTLHWNGQKYTKTV